MTINAQNRTLPDWFTRIRLLQTRLPRFQRFEAWDHSNVTQMFNTILRGLPLGATLVLEIGNEEPFLSRPIKGAPTTGERATEHLLDGQQRLTALWRGLHNNYEERTFFLYLREEEETDMPYFIDSVARWKKEGDTDRRPFWANEIKDLWQRRMIPLDLCAPGDEASRQFKDWIRVAVPDANEREDIIEIRNKVAMIFATFNLPYLSLPVTTNKDTALDVFIKMNTSAAPLSRYDIVVAQVEAAMGESLHDLIAKAKQECPTIDIYYPIEELTLYASALLQGRPPSSATYFMKDFGKELLANWQTLVRGMKRTAEFLEEERVFDAARLPTDVAVPVLVALWAVAPQALDPAGQARTTIRKYFWRAAFSDRYERATGSRALVDFTELKPLVTGEDSSSQTPAIFDDELHPLPPEQELLAVGWPKKKERLARAILAAALRNGGWDLADGSAVTRANLASREYHHLFPVALLRDRKQRSNGEIYRALNCALVTWQTNRNISDSEPERYLAQRRDANTLGDEEVKARLTSHLIPYDELIGGDYDAFLKKRAQLVHAKLTTLCSGGAA
ncbi:DUF262 domain-containing protein [Consotaella salsifontis]|uniref:GmrSD restriction endonucleases N-terminal domain-containing protein n=1 Tax=Consotaella salsifontis TaxID=1365950 RepID=A0A1T4STY5_9HYPH|nr:DUF262 domain-containing protein [Consotaella salsifontis]SKA31633.1 hypothetical protein SAMN05428963_11438 [Consotaella salsifontis]